MSSKMNDMRNTVLLSVNDITAERGDRVLFSNLSFKLSSGHVIWLQGDNGIGKTSLLRITLGLSKPKVGEIKWFRNNENCRPEDNMVYQAHRNPLKPNMTAKEDLEYWADIYDEKPDIDKILDKVGLSNRSSILNFDLSAGHKRRLVLARLLISKKPVWILDEPAAAMDENGRQLIYDIISEHIALGGAALIASHEKAHSFGPMTQRLVLENI